MGTVKALRDQGASGVPKQNLASTEWQNILAESIAHLGKDQFYEHFNGACEFLLDCESSLVVILARYGLTTSGASV